MWLVVEKRPLDERAWLGGADDEQSPCVCDGNATSADASHAYRVTVAHRWYVWPLLG